LTLGSLTSATSLDRNIDSLVATVAVATMMGIVVITQAVDETVATVLAIANNLRTMAIIDRAITDTTNTVATTTANMATVAKIDLDLVASTNQAASTGQVINSIEAEASVLVQATTAGIEKVARIGLPLLLNLSFPSPCSSCNP